MTKRVPRAEFLDAAYTSARGDYMHAARKENQGRMHKSERKYEAESGRQQRCPCPCSCPRAVGGPAASRERKHSQTKRRECWPPTMLQRPTHERHTYSRVEGEAPAALLDSSARRMRPRPETVRRSVKSPAALEMRRHAGGASCEGARPVICCGPASIMSAWSWARGCMCHRSRPSPRPPSPTRGSAAVNAAEVSAPPKQFGRT